MHCSRCYTATTSFRMVFVAHIGRQSEKRALPLFLVMCRILFSSDINSLQLRSPGSRYLDSCSRCMMCACLVFFPLISFYILSLLIMIIFALLFFLLYLVSRVYVHFFLSISYVHFDVHDFMQYSNLYLLSRTYVHKRTCIEPLAQSSFAVLQSNQTEQNIFNATTFEHIHSEWM